MSETSPVKRLMKVATELNVGVQTVMDFLSAKGFSDINRNSKITDDMYALLMKEYGKEKDVKEESKKIIQSRIKRETVTLDETQPSQTKAGEVEHEPEEVLVKNLNPVVERPKQEIPVVKAPEPETPPAPAPIEEPVNLPPVVEVKPEVTEVEVKTDVEIGTSPEVKGPKVLGTIDLDALKGNKGKKKEAPKEEKQKEEPPATVEEPKLPEGDTPKDIVDAPIVSEAPKPIAPEEPAEAKTEEAAEDALYRAPRSALTGPKILGTIQLPDKKPIASSNNTQQSANQAAKKKRKRIEGPVGGSGQQQGGNQQGGNQQGHNQRGPSHGKPGNRPAPAPKVQLTEEEVQKQIKETLARLSGQSKQKSKSAKHRKQKREDYRAAQEEAELENQNMVIKVTEFVTANELAKMMNVPVNSIIATCMTLGLFVSINQRLDAETLTIVASEFGYKVEFVSVEVQEAIREDEDTDDELQPRPPIVTVMGHVDHGKTSLLDYIRKSNVIAGEAGGITQHIGAYNVKMENGKKITFLDTPGHEAFTAMRARGAQVTDVAIIVIAADDSVMPQTVEAINHAQAAQVPIVFAINKIDKPGANPDKIREQLAAMNILVEDWGGKYQVQEVAAKQGKNVDLLLEKVLLEAELLDLKANPNKRAAGTIIESELDKGRGYVSTVLVTSGTLRIGDVVLAGVYSGRVKALFNERGQPVKEAGPSISAQMLGLSGAPASGDKFNVMSDEREAREIANKRQQLQREQGIRTHKHITLDEIGRRIAIGDFKELNIIVKGDVDGSVEALSDSLLKLSTEKIQVNIIHKSVGQVTESDVLLASASNAIIVGFQVRPSSSARKLAESEQIDMRFYSIIYNAIEEVKAAMEGMLAPEYEEKIVCNVEVRETFKISRIGTIAGCYVLDGKINRNTKIRLIRDGIVVYSGGLGSLKRFKDDVKEVSTGYECGLNIDGFNDIKVGDIIEGYEQVEIKRKL
jgi:translation initiation factor IF-2